MGLKRLPNATRGSTPPPLLIHFKPENMVSIIKAIKIDAWTQQVYFINLPLSLDGIYEAIGCRLFDVVHLPDMDVMVDDEGAEGTVGFHISGVPVKGNGLVVGFDPERDTHINTPHSLPYVTSRVRFFKL